MTHAEYHAHNLPVGAISALLTAYRDAERCYRLQHGVRDTKAGQTLFRYGCVEARGPYLTVHGTEVRSAALEAMK